MGWTIKPSRSSFVIFLMPSPVAMSNGCAPVLASYSAITLFTSSMSAVAGSYSRSVLSPWDENVRILAVMFGLLRDVHLRSSVEQQSTGFGSPPLILHRFSGLSIGMFLWAWRELIGPHKFPAYRTTAKKHR